MTVVKVRSGKFRARRNGNSNGHSHLSERRVLRQSLRSIERELHEMSQEDNMRDEKREELLGLRQRYQHILSIRFGVKIAEGIALTRRPEVLREAIARVIQQKGRPMRAEEIRVALEQEGRAYSITKVRGVLYRKGAAGSSEFVRTPGQRGLFDVTPKSEKSNEK